MKRSLLSSLMCLSTVALLATACGDDLRPEPDPDDETPDQTAQHITHTDLGNGVTRSSVDATSEDLWVYLDLDTGREVSPASPETDPDWDIAFQRFQVRSNSGISGTGGVQTAILAEQDFDALTAAPADGWRVDEEDSDDEGTEPDYVFLQDGFWYAYDLASHTLQPRDRVYVVKTGAGAHFKLQFLAYYDDAGTSGVPSFKWAEISGPSESSDTLSVDASSANAWTYVSVADGVITPADPETSLDWDFAINRTAFRTNGGLSGSGVGGAKLVGEGVDYDTVTEVSTLGFAVDAEYDLGFGGPVVGSATLAGWYDYDLSTHAVTPGDRVYALRTANGDYAKLRILTWEGGHFTLRVAPVDGAVTAATLTVDATDNSVWTHVSLREGAIVEVTDPAADARWDLAFNRVNIRTNSGTSGTGLGGAVEASVTVFDEVLEVPVDAAFEADVMVPPSAPGGTEVSQSPVLGAWWDYNLETHQVSPADKTFLVRTADGDFAKVRIETYVSGVYTLKVAYAGPGSSAF